MSDLTDASNETIDDQDVEIPIRKAILVDVLGLLRSPEIADRRTATKVSEAIERAFGSVS